MRSRTLKLALIPLAIVILGGAAFFFLPKSEKKQADSVYKTSPIARGNLEETVSSNGNLKAVGTVDVLTQVTGTLEKVFVDFNDHVKKNQPLAQINTDKLKITLKQTQAALDKARAQNEYDSVEYEKSRTLRERLLISDTELASKKLAFLTSKATLLQAEASYEEARLNIENYALILSPIDGIVLVRSVDPGQTVVGSGSTNTLLFTLAENMDTMDIKALVDELDISKIKVGQNVRFSVETYTDRKFSGTIRQLRVVPSSSDNVVSYIVMISAENKDGALLPGMTATVEFLISEKKDVVLVPNTALRFTPAAEVQAIAKRKAFEERLKGRSEAERQAALKQYDDRLKTGNTGANSLLSGAQRLPRAMSGTPGGLPPGPGGPPPGAGGPGGNATGIRLTTTSENRKSLWFLENDGSVSVRNVEVGVSDGTNTEIVAGEALIGKHVITRAQ
ncbi:MAG: efflux RND transporter periplasmic adaptor subunit [Treponemataceae bacterium]